LFSKTLISVVIAVLLVALVYGSVSIFNVYGLPPDPNWGKTGECFVLEGGKDHRCCWEEPDILNPGETITWCQTCDTATYPPTNCGPVFIETPSPTGPFGPLGGGVLQQPTTTPTAPPLFGRNVPLQGFGVLGQQPAAIVPPSPLLTPVPPVLTPEPPVPMFGSTQEATPTPPPQFGQIAPQGRISPSLGEETQEQATEEQTTEEDEQVIAKDDDDGPVPPECPTTGPIPPDCTMKPKFPEERAIE
jgi:hypothetical protein